MATSLLGWLSSAVLLLTIGSQIRRHWKSGTSVGVSPLLYLGQLTASSGLCLYSYLGRQWVFFVINAAMALAAIAGFMLWRRFARRSSDDSPVA